MNAVVDQEDFGSSDPALSSGPAFLTRCLDASDASLREWVTLFPAGLLLSVLLGKKVSTVRKVRRRLRRSSLGGVVDVTLGLAAQSEDQVSLDAFLDHSAILLSVRLGASLPTATLDAYRARPRLELKVSYSTPE